MTPAKALFERCQVIVPPEARADQAARLDALADRLTPRSPQDAEVARHLRDIAADLRRHAA